MDTRYKIELVQKMQDYIVSHAQDEDFRLDNLYLFVGYSKRHADRCFQSLLGKTPKEYLKLIKMTDSARQILDNNSTILDAALRAGFESHEGYTKAFRDRFGKLPSEYKKGKSFIPLFIPYPIKGCNSRTLNQEDKINMEHKSCLCMITPVLRPKRKLIFHRSQKAHDYWTYCEECCCDWEGLLNSIPAKFDTATILTLPSFLMKEGYGNIAAGIEVPFEYDGEIPKNYEIAELPPCEMLFFQSQAFQTQQEFFILIGELFRAVDTFDYAAYGYQIADELAPRFNFGGQRGAGAKLAVPIVRI